MTVRTLRLGLLIPDVRPHALAGPPLYPKLSYNQVSANLRSGFPCEATPRPTRAGPARPERGRILSFSVPLHVARCPFVYRIDPSGKQALMIDIATPGQQGPNSVTHSGPASVRAPQGPHRSRTCSLQRAPRLRTTRTGGSPEPIGKLGNLRPQVAKLRTLGFFWPDEMGDFLARRAHEGVS